MDHVIHQEVFIEGWTNIPKKVLSMIEPQSMIDPQCVHHAGID